MKFPLITAVLISFFLFPASVFALSAPVQLTPSDTVSVSIPVLNWQTPSYNLFPTNPYRVQIDNDSQFGSPEKDYYTSNTAYSPNLSDGVWYWRVRAKNENGTASDWSNTWSFTLVSATPSPSPSPSPSSTPTPTASPSPSPTSSFTISGTKTSLGSEENTPVTIKINGLTPGEKYFLKGAFIKDGSSNYFGKTLVGTTWVKNSQTYSSQFPFSADSSGSFEGTVSVMPDSDDSGFTGSGDYLLKVGRYSSSGSGPVWSNEIKVNITQDLKAGSGSTLNTPEPSSSIKPSPSSYVKSRGPKSASTNPIPTFESSNSSESAIVESEKQNINSQKGEANLLFLGAGFIVLAGGGTMFFSPRLKMKILDKLSNLSSGGKI